MRYATLFDTEFVIDCLKQFAIESHHAMAHDPMLWSRQHIENILAQIHAGRGFVLIEDGGILVAIRGSSFWVKDWVQLQEVALFGNNITKARLIKEYVKISKEMIAKGEIHEAVMASNLDVNLERCGMIQFEKHWRVI